MKESVTSNHPVSSTLLHRASALQRNEQATHFLPQILCTTAKHWPAAEVKLVLLGFASTSGAGRLSLCCLRPSTSWPVFL